MKTEGCTSNCKLASIDIGSNSFLLLLCEANSDGIGKINKDVIEIVRLGQGLSTSKRFLPEALVRAEQTLVRFKTLVSLYQPDIILAKATAAARKAENRNELLVIGKNLGLPIEIIPGEKEAQITYQGVYWGRSVEKDSFNLLVDIGGGSTELIVGRGLEIEYSISLPFGAVLLTEHFIKKHPVSTIDEHALKAEIRTRIGSAIKEISRFAIKHVLAVAGTPTTLAEIIIGGYDSAQIDGYLLSTQAMSSLEDKLKSRSIEQRITELKVPKGRADILYAGTVLLRMLTEALRIENVTVSTRGVRHGIVADYFLNQLKPNN